MARQRPGESLRKMAKAKAGTCPQVNVPTVVSHSPLRSEPLPMQPEPNTFRSLLGRSGLYALELPALRPVSEPWRRHLFRRPYGAENDYYGVYPTRSEEHTSELQSLMRISYAVFCLKKKTNKTNSKTTNTI